MAVSYLEKDKKGHRPTLGSIDRKIILYNKILEGCSYFNLINGIMDDAFGFGRKYTRRRATEMLEDLQDEMRQTFDKERESLIHQNYERLIDIYSEAREYDKGTALNAIKEINKMIGAYEAKKVDLNVSGELEIDFGTENETKI